MCGPGLGVLQGARRAVELVHEATRESAEGKLSRVDQEVASFPCEDTDT